MILIPITKDNSSSSKLVRNEVLERLIQRILNSDGYSEREAPWLGYFAKVGDDYVGSCGFKSNPLNGRVEIAYETFEPFRQKGYATEMCRQLNKIATIEKIQVFALTTIENTTSERVLENNNFIKVLQRKDHDGTLVNEWHSREP